MTPRSGRAGHGAGRESILSPTAKRAARATRIASPRPWTASIQLRLAPPMGRSGQSVPVPRVVGPIRRTRPVQVRDVAFLRRHTQRRIKVTIPGPFTMSQQAQNDYYRDEESMALAYAEAVT